MHTGWKPSLLTQPRRRMTRKAAAYDATGQDPPAAHRGQPSARAESLLLVCVVVGVLLAVGQSIHEVRIPYQIDSGEGVVLEGAGQIVHGQRLYPRADQFPYPMRVYGPLAYGMVAIPVELGGVNFLWPRVLVLGCAIFSGFCVAALLRRWTGSWRIGFIFGAGFLVLPITRPWLYVLRVDFIGLAFTLAGLLVFVRSPRRWPWSALLFGAALFCKVSLIAAPAVVFICLLAENRRSALAFLAWLAALCMGVFAVCEIRTHGWFAFHMFGTHPDRYLLKQFVLLAGLVVVSALITFVFAVIYVAREFVQRHVSVAGVYLPATLLTSLTAGKLGATTNHFLEFLAAGSLAAGLGYWEMKRDKHRFYGVLSGGLAATLALAAVLQTRPSTWPDSDLTQCGEAYRYIANVPGQRILSENVGALLVSRKPVLIADPFPYTQLVQNAGWPDDQLIGLIKSHYFEAIVLGGEASTLGEGEDRPWPAGVLQAIAQDYRVSKRFDCRRASVMLEPAGNSRR